MEKLKLRSQNSSTTVQVKTEVKHIFSPTTTSSSTTPSPSVKPSAANPAKKSLSKFVEYPGDIEKIKTLLADETVDPAGKDFYGEFHESRS